tara:strand:+ start:2104 stop:2607 length:504 start_codon:yes stop_codon:yes gene_type:complete
MKRLVVGKGNLNANVIIVGEAPGAREDAEGIPFVGKSGKFLSQLLIKAGFNLEKDIYFCNVIKCRPPNNRKPTNKEVIIHKPWLFQQIKLINPKFIILAGSTAMKAVLSVNASITSLRGKWINMEGKEYIPIFHPSYLMRFKHKEKNSPYGLTLKDLQYVRNKLYNL